MDEDPLQMIAGRAVTLSPGTDFAVTVIESVLLHPLPSVPVNVKI